MRILPCKKLINIPSGNPYKGRDGYVDIAPDMSVLDIADLFPFHPVSAGWRPAAKNITSHLLQDQIRVFYTANNIVSEIEILAPNASTPEMAIQEISIGNTNVFGKTLDIIRKNLAQEGFEVIQTDTGLSLVTGCVDFYSNEFAGDLNVKLDSVVMRFMK